MADIENDDFEIRATSKITAFEINHFAKLVTPKTADFEIDHFS